MKSLLLLSALTAFGLATAAAVLAQDGTPGAMSARQRVETGLALAGKQAGLPDGPGQRVILFEAGTGYQKNATNALTKIDLLGIRRLTVITVADPSQVVLSPARRDTTNIFNRITINPRLPYASQFVRPTNSNERVISEILMPGVPPALREINQVVMPKQTVTPSR